MIKHMPSGLFPHFDSAFERRPYFVKVGDYVELGCRLDESDVAEVSMEVTNSSGTWVLPGIYHSTNDRGQRYFQFHMGPDETESDFTYRFITSTGETSKKYVCPVLREISFLPEIQRRDSTTTFIYRADTQEYRLTVQAIPSIQIFLARYSTGSVNNSQIISNVLTENECYAIEKDGRCVLRIWPKLTLMIHENGDVYNLRLRFDFPGSAFYGLGEKFDSVNQRGKRPLNYVLEQFSNQQDKTYLPIPFTFTDGGVSFLQTTTYLSRFDFTPSTEEGWMGMELFACCPKEGNLFSANVNVGTPQQLLKAYAEETGAPVLPPKWVFGPWMSSNGWNTQKEALEQLEKMKGTAIPATVMVLEAWSDEETFYIWNDAKYTPRKGGGKLKYTDFTFPEDGKWPDPKSFCETLADNDVKLILWQIPVIKYEAANHGVQLDLDWEYAVENGLCLKNADGSPYQITEMWFGNSLIPDFTNPETVTWWNDCRRYLIDELGVVGFKTDGGEFLFDPGAVFHDGRTVAEAHNEFANIYENTYHEMLKDSSGITFSRAGFTGAQRYPIHWAGDQVSTFSELKGQLTAGLSLGLSGVPFWGFDIGGFAGDFPTTELYLRSAALAAFVPVMQFHSEPRGGQYYMVARNHWNNDRSPWNIAEANRDDRIIPIYRLFANLRMNLIPYIWQEAKYCAESVRPMMAHLIYDFPDDPVVLGIEDEYMFGRDLLVAPVITEGSESREVYLPEGAWSDFWTGDPMTGKQIIKADCPLDRIPVFVRSGAAIPMNINDVFCLGTQEKVGAMPNHLDRYENLCFLLYGSNGQGHFQDEHGSDIDLVWTEDGESVTGHLSCEVTLFRMDGQDHGNHIGHLFGRAVKGTRKEKLCVTM